jgi:hypothetical protein
VGQIGSVYKQPEKREDDPVTAGGRQVSGIGVQRGVKREQQGEQGEAEKRAKNPRRVYVIVTYV